MSNTETPLGAIAKGSLAGIVGTVVLTVAMQQVPNLLEQLGLDPPKQGEGSGVGGGGKSEQAVEKLASKISKDLFEKPLNRKEQQVAGQLLHWAYGVGWGSFYGVMQSTFKFPHLLHGTLLAGIMGLTAATVPPAMHIVPAPKDLPPQRVILQLTYILLFGWTTALVYDLLSRRK